MSFRRYLTGLLLAASLTALATPVLALPTIAEKTLGMRKLDGYVPLYWDEANGKLWMEVSRFGEEFLYYPSLAAGLGSNDIGLDRGLLGEEKIVRFERVGPKVLLIAPNYRYRAVSPDPTERRAVRESFAEGVLWGFTASAATGDRVLVDATDFVVRDASGAIERLKQAKQGNFKLDQSRSALYLENTKAFPENTEVEARLTLTSDDPGNFVRDVAAEPQSVTMQIHQSFVKLPAPYTPRVYDPRSSFISTQYADYGTPVGDSLVKRLITRHRIEKKDPTAAVSEPVAPIVYYLDPGTPEPIRSALLEGARWWNQAFEAAGFKNGFRVEMLPEGADILDIRYNVIQWVHRATRGWSYGASVIDPRTGQIIKGKVTLGSLRVRQDYLIAEGLLAPYAQGVPVSESDPMLAMSLARLRQLSAHEVGHTLGLLHNFAASNTGRASVMDYPAPLATLGKNGLPDLSNAYALGIGEWDKVSIRYGYSHFPPGTDEAKALDAILADARRRGLQYLTDQDGRGAVGAQPFVNTWDNGREPLSAMKTQMAVRRVALERFGPANIRPGAPLATMEEVLVPLYLGHRYQAIATAKMLGGLDYSYSVRGDGSAPPKPIAGDQQRAALNLLLDAVSPAALRLPASIRDLLAPRPPGWGRTRELFVGHTGQVFDLYAPAEVGAGMVFDLLTDPQRVARIAVQKDFHRDLPDLAEVFDRVSARVWRSPVAGDHYDAGLQRLAQIAWSNALIEVAAGSEYEPRARAIGRAELKRLDTWLERNPGADADSRAHRTFVRDEIARFFARAWETPRKKEVSPYLPPGEPIGQDEENWTGRRQERQLWLDRMLPGSECAEP